MTAETTVLDTAMGPDTNTKVEARVIVGVVLEVPLTTVGGTDTEIGNLMQISMRIVVDFNIISRLAVTLFCSFSVRGGCGGGYDPSRCLSLLVYKQWSLVGSFCLNFGCIKLAFFVSMKFYSDKGRRRGYL